MNENKVGTLSKGFNHLPHLVPGGPIDSHDGRPGPITSHPWGCQHNHMRGTHLSAKIAHPLLIGWDNQCQWIQCHWFCFLFLFFFKGYKKILLQAWVVLRQKTISCCGMQSYLGKSHLHTWWIKQLISQQNSVVVHAVRLMLRKLSLSVLTALREPPLSTVSTSCRHFPNLSDKIFFISTFLAVNDVLFYVSSLECHTLTK